MRNLFALLTLVMFSLAVSACDDHKFWAGMNNPRNPMMPMPEVGSFMSPDPVFMRNLPDGDDSYSHGFRDGCDTYMAMQGSGLMQMKGYKWDNMRMLQDPNYNKGFVDGRNHCTYVMHPAVN